MESKAVKSGDLLARRDGLVDNIWYIGDGSVYAVCGSLKINLKKGDFIGIADFDRGLHSFDYIAAEPSTIINFCTREALMQSNFFAAKPENSRAIALSLNHIVRDSFIFLNSLCSRSEEIFKSVHDSYNKYMDLCKQVHVEYEKLDLMDELSDPVSMGYSHKCFYQYHKGTSMQLSGRESAAEMTKNLIIPGYMLHAASDLQEVINSVEFVYGTIEDCNQVMFSEDNNDLMNRYNELYIKAGEGHSLSESIMSEMMNIYDNARETSADIRDSRLEEMKARSENFKNVEREGSKNVAAELLGSMDQIMQYANFTGTGADEFKKAVKEYKNFADPNSTEDYARNIRKIIEKYFYQLYLSALEVAIEQPDCPILLKMFLYFGYLDEDLAGMSNAFELYELAQTYHGNPEKGVFTGFEWLLAIFNKDREPSINEFDQTYEQFIKEQYDNGRIPREQLNLYLADRGQMVMFELQNMFKSASRMCSGRIVNFCPIFCEHQILRSAKEDILDSMDIIEGRDSIRKVDYTLFHRETVFVYDKKENIYDTIHVEILPDIILLPVVGSRGAMWQEIVGRDRLTPARMMLPVFDVESLDKALIRIFGEYRWEMCKRSQGARWNDVTSPSLTSLYYDYLQFYRKNSNISMDQKEKIKIQLQRSRNVYKEFFISDYAEYIKYEAAGSPHLIRASRAILYMQCPFGVSVRRSLASNPIFSEYEERLKVKNGQHIHKLNNIQKKLVSKGLPVPAELERELAYYSI